MLNIGDIVAIIEERRRIVVSNCFGCAEDTKYKIVDIDRGLARIISPANPKEFFNPVWIPLNHLAAECATIMGSADRASVYPEMGWQPIETAPKDGTHIIVAYAKRYAFASRRIWANIVKWDSTYNGWVDDETEHFMSDKMYSHWMPLLPIDPEK